MERDLDRDLVRVKWAGLSWAQRVARAFSCTSKQFFKGPPSPLPSMAALNASTASSRSLSLSIKSPSWNRPRHPHGEPTSQIQARVVRPRDQPVKLAYVNQDAVHTEGPSRLYRLEWHPKTPSVSTSYTVFVCSPDKVT